MKASISLESWFLFFLILRKSACLWKGKQMFCGIPQGNTPTLAVWQQIKKIFTAVNFANFDIVCLSKVVKLKIDFRCRTEKSSVIQCIFTQNSTVFNGYSLATVFRIVVCQCIINTIFMHQDYDKHLALHILKKEKNNSKNCSIKQSFLSVIHIWHRWHNCSFELYLESPLRPKALLTVIYSKNDSLFSNKKSNNLDCI